MSICRICIRDTGSNADYHPRCLAELVDTRRPPALDLDLAELFSLASQQVGKMSISGVQAKVLAKLSDGQAHLKIVESGGTHIVKPQQPAFARMPENEHVTMQLARLVGIDTPPNGLLSLKDGSLAYIVKRFDRLEDGTKLRVEDLCQLAGKRSRDKYDGSAELCVRLLRKYASAPLIEIRRLYQQLLFGWCVGNGDMHLKNFAMLTLPDSRQALSPAYDLVSTVLVIAHDNLAMPVSGKRDHLTRKAWTELATYSGLPPRAAEALVSAQVEALEPSVRLIRDSFLPPDMKQEYEAVITDRTRILASRRPSDRPADP
jgi:serine/threonine-protein kinase HipA